MVLTKPATPTYTLSREAHTLKRSVMRELIKQAAAPGVISLAGGLPDTSLLPHDAYRDCLDAVLTREGGTALQYRPQYAPLKEWIAAYMRGRGVDCTPEQIHITNGNQQGLTILSRLFLDPGAPAVIEAVTFTGVQQVTAGRAADVLTVPTDLETGVDLDALAAAFAQHPRLAVLIPDFHNPLGVSIKADKRTAIADMAAHYSVPVIEDDPYSALRFEGEPIMPIKAHDDAGMVFYLGSFSKMLAPGLRLGWMVAPDALTPQITTIRESLDLETSNLTQHAVYEFLSRGLLHDHLDRVRTANRQRRDALLDALATHFGHDAHWTTPDGGMFVWVTLPETVDTWDALPHAIDAHQVAYVPGSAFAVDGGYRNTLRLNFSATPPDGIREGVRRIAAALGCAARP